jgi:hypothetical protein
MKFPRKRHDDENVRAAWLDFGRDSVLVDKAVKYMIDAMNADFKPYLGWRRCLEESPVLFQLSRSPLSRSREDVPSGPSALGAYGRLLCTDHLDTYYYKNLRILSSGIIFA